MNTTTINGLIFKSDLLLMKGDPYLPTINEGDGEYIDVVTVRETAWYKDNINLYEDSLQKAKHANGLFQESFMETYHEDGTPTGEVHSYDDIHKYGLWHKAVHIWVVNSLGEILLHKRSDKVQTRPGLWENTTGGHIDEGHTSSETAKKELSEELGIDLPEELFEYIATIVDQFVTNGGNCINNEFDDFYIVSVGDKDLSITAHLTEVAETKWIHFKQLEEHIMAHDPLYMPRQAEYDILFPLLHQRFDGIVG
jgi:isopentenyl-diphosphate delta-isomerase